MNKIKLRIKYPILFIMLVILGISISFFSTPSKSDFIIDCARDNIGNLYTMSYDEKEIILKKINNDEILWTSKFDRNGSDFINVPNYLTVTPEGKLIVYVYQFDLNSYNKKSEKIYLYSIDGKDKKVIFNDEEDLGIEQTIFGMNYYGDDLYFFQLSSKSNEEKQLVNVKKINLDLENNGNLPKTTTIKTIEYNSNIGINKYIYTKSNNIIYTTYNSEIYKISHNNENKKLYPINDKENKGISGVSYDLDDNLYFQDVANNKIMTINTSKEEIQELYDNKELQQAGIDYKSLKKIKFVSKDKFYGFQVSDVKNNNIISIYDNNKVTNLINFKYSLKVIFFKIVLVILIFIIIIVIIFTIKAIIKKFQIKSTIILKQTLVFIPIIIISILIIFFIINNKFTEVVKQQLIEQIYTISENKKNTISGEKIKNIDWKYPYNNKDYMELKETLQLYRSNEKIYSSLEKKNIDNPHNSIYSLLYIIKDNKIYTGICDLNYVNIPIDYIYSKYDLEVYKKAYISKTYVYTELKDSNGDWLAVIAPILDESGNVVALTEIGVTKQGFVNNMIFNNAREIAVINIIIGVIMIFVLVIFLYYLLIPLKKLKLGVTELMKGNLGTQILIKSNDEVAEISKVFNEMSLNLKNDMDKLTKLNDVYHRFVPLKMFEILNKKNVLEVKIGDQVKTNISLLALTANNFKELSANMNTDKIFIFINNMFSAIAPIISEDGGIVERYNNAGLISLFPQNSISAINAAIKIRENIRLNNKNELDKVEIGFVINKEEVMLGIIGCEERLGASVISDYLTIIESLNSFGEKYGSNILVTETCIEEVKITDESYNYRTLGYIKYKNKDQIVKLYDFFDGDNYEIIELKKQTKDIFEKGVQFYWNKDFYNARRIFIEVLKQFKEDKASKEYLRLCDKYYKIKDVSNIEPCLELF